MRVQLGQKHFLLLALAACLYAAGVRAQGLFPPLYSAENFATSNPVTATSTCGRLCGEEGEEVGCGSSCNDTCPFGDTLPEPLDLMTTGTLQAGVVSFQWTTGKILAVALLFFRQFSAIRDQRVQISTS